VASQPRVQLRPAQAYVAVAVSLAVDELHIVDGIFFELFGWLANRGLTAHAAPFIRYVVVDMAGLLEIEVGIPVANTVTGDAQVISGVIPAGSYATLTYSAIDQAGDIQANAELQAWGAERGLAWKQDRIGEREVWGGRFEFYPTALQNDGQRNAELAYLLDE
jgi:hypothetical protein